jgi:catechol-2,3-dioxygenase
MPSPVKLSHYVLQTNQIQALRAWYLAVLGGEIVHEDPHLCFIAYDDEHHRIAFVDFEPLRKKTEKDVGLHHVAFTFTDLRTLLETHERLKRDKSIAPYWCINHGPTTSLYYHDPDGNGCELQVDNFANLADCKAFMRSPEFASNPLGVEFDPDEMLRRLRAGTPERKFLVRAELEHAMA